MAVLFRFRCNECINLLPVHPDNILYIRNILQTSLDFERDNTRPGHIPYPLFQREILKREEGLVLHQNISVHVSKIVSGSARLDTSSPVCASSREILTHIALAAIRDAQSSMNEIGRASC